MTTLSVALLVKRHVRLHAALRVIELYSAGEGYSPLLHEMSPAMRRAVEGLLRAAAESWGNAVADLEHEEGHEAHWLR
jgi:hypothetical protein